jgi:hypothetical protein
VLYSLFMDIAVPYFGIYRLDNHVRHIFGLFDKDMVYNESVDK